MPATTPKALYINEVLKRKGLEPLDALVSRLRQSSEIASWRTIAKIVEDATDITVEDDTLASWFPEYHRNKVTA